MRPAILALLAMAIAAPAVAPAQDVPSPTGEGAYFCFWIDAGKKEAATTALFRAPIEQSEAISLQFIKAIQASEKSKARARVYDCSYRRDPVQAEQDRQSLRGAHAGKGFSLVDLDWTPASE